MTPPPSNAFDVLIVGAGHAGAHVAASLRQGGLAGAIGLIGEEPDPPYERPPLSKDFLLGEKSFERILIRPAAFWTDKNITLLLGRRIVSVDPAAKRVTSSAGETFAYGQLIWAAGGVARRLTCQGHDLSGVHTIRSRADVERLRRQLVGAERVVVVGAGYIGLEAASVLNKLGKSVTVLETQDRVLARVTSAPVSRFFEGLHRRHGVDVRLNAAVSALEGSQGRVTGVRLADGALLDADLVIVGIGLVPAVEPLLAAGARGLNGVDIDGACRTSLPDILAIGDCAAHENAYADNIRIRLESVQNAHDQAAVAAKTVLGQTATYAATPWFWSNQYDVRLQTVGLFNGHDTAVVRGDPTTGAFSVVYLRDRKVCALDCLNTPKDFVQGKALVVARAMASPSDLANTALPLKALIGSAAA
ncbi:FAD-dependent oxidoreductase [Caulobacter sp. SSI4214]|uniref:NAD(P)/FAD-dependent oxidoreductase n=1 Tax=Caulobacter sp. SSI4214 TaxID=2575739 RepID=UPI0019D6508D|nr:FAD-dependent oxidoreductase [Caulobacter sp. SSI4214]